MACLLLVYLYVAPKPAAQSVGQAAPPSTPFASSTTLEGILPASAGSSSADAAVTDISRAAAEALLLESRRLESRAHGVSYSLEASTTPRRRVAAQLAAAATSSRKAP